VTLHLGWHTGLYLLAVFGALVLIRAVVMTVMFMFMDYVPPWRRS